MFTGIVEELGQVKEISRRGKVTLLTIAAHKALEEAAIGDSICVNGVCLTIVNKTKSTLSFEMMPQTLRISNLGGIKIGDKVNLERSLRAGDKISGHFVTGHIDCTGIIRSRSYVQDNLAFGIAAAQEYVRLVLDKGSVAVDGISLTVAKKHADMFWVYIIPHTAKNTTLGFKGPSAKVNIELDVLAKAAANRINLC